MTAQLERIWTGVCQYDWLLPERGVAALIGGVQVAVFRTFEGMVHAVGNRDPFTGAYVLSRGIVGTRGDSPTVASPLHKQVFELTTGVCVSDDSVRIPVYAARVRDGVVEVAVEASG